MIEGIVVIAGREGKGEMAGRKRGKWLRKVERRKAVFRRWSAIQKPRWFDCFGTCTKNLVQNVLGALYILYVVW